MTVRPFWKYMQSILAGTLSMGLMVEIMVQYFVLHSLSLFC